MHLLNERGIQLVEKFLQLFTEQERFFLFLLAFCLIHFLL